jgi:ABC-type enterochelin transport system substrate-binding protein
MMQYPVRVPHRDYSGNNASKRQRVAEFNRLGNELVSHINNQIEKSPKDVVVFEYADLARIFKLSVEEVSDILGSVGGGHNGLTVAKRV